MSWTFKGGRYITGWGVLERGLCACAAFALIGNDGDVDTLKADIHARLQDDRAPEQEVLVHAARGIRERADNLPMRGHWSSRIEAVMSQMGLQNSCAAIERDCKHFISTRRMIAVWRALSEQIGLSREVSSRSLR